MLFQPSKLSVSCHVLRPRCAAEMAASASFTEIPSIVVKRHPLQQSLHYQSIECHLLSVKTSGGSAASAETWSLAIIYRPPSSSLTVFTVSRQTCLSELTLTLIDSSHAATSTARRQCSVTASTATYCRCWTCARVCVSSCRLLRGARPPAEAVSSMSSSPTERRADCISWSFNRRMTYLITTWV